MTRILAVRSAFPAHRYPQAELTATFAELSGLGPAERALLERLHANAGVEPGIPCCRWRSTADLRGVGPANDRYIDEATDARASRRCAARWTRPGWPPPTWTC